MKAGLLMCDHVMANYQTEFGNYSDMFINLFPDFEWIIYDVYKGDFPQNIKECDVYFATGSKHSVYDNLVWIEKLKDIIREIYHQQKYFVGFCFGHQLIGEALGGHVGKSPNGWCVGVFDFDVVQKEKWMVPYQDQLGLLMMCQDQILELPNDSIVLASNEKCPNGIIRVGKTFLGIQAHPEFTKDYDEMLMRTRMNRMGDEVAENGISSLDKPVHSEVIRDWVIQFLNEVC